MKKAVAVLLSLVVALGSVSLCYATQGNIMDEEQNLERFIAVKSHVVTLVKGTGASASYTALVTTISNTSLDLVNMDIKVVKKSTGTVVYSQKNAIKYSSSWQGFRLRENCSLPSRGDYYIKATYKCYKGGRLIETLYGTSKVIAY